jgi:hypothetical protein
MRALSFGFFVTIILIPGSALAQEIEVTPEEAYAGGPAAPIISSSDLPDPDKWYQPRDAVFTWQLPGDATAVATDLVSSPNTEPQTAHRPPIDSVTMAAADWQEGVQYLAVQFRNAEKWGWYSTYKVQIDGTPPDAFAVTVTPHTGHQSGVILRFAASDALSGVSHYEVRAGTQVSRVLPPETTGGYFIPLTGSASQNVEVVAYDQAGNMQATTVTVVPVPPPRVNPQTDPLAFVAEDPAPVLLAIMAGLLLLMFGYLVYERQRYSHGLSELRSETDDVQTEMLKVFGALREEIYDQINAIDRKPRLTKKEQEAVTGLNKALAVSEKLLAKEVKDLKKIIS